MKEDLLTYAKEHHVPVMQEAGLQFLMDQLQQHHCKQFLEIGTAIAKTSIAIAQSFPDIQIVTIERNPEMIQQAKQNIVDAGLESRILLIEGDALEVSIPDRVYDYIFIDAAKAQYQRFFERYCPFLSQDGIIITDNMEFHGLVQHPELTKNRNTKQLVRKIQKYHEYLENLTEFDTEFYSIGDGVAITRRHKS